MAAPRRRLSPAEYLEIERKAEFRSEYYRGEMFPIPGSSFEHVKIMSNLIGEIGSCLNGTTCHTLSRDMRIKVPSEVFYTYPDMVILCGKPELEDDYRDTLLNPGVTIEIVSDATELNDRGRKFEQYQRIPSVREYILVCQDRMRIERFARQPDESWTLTVFADPAADFALLSVPVRVPLRDIYAGVELSPADAESV